MLGSCSATESETEPSNESESPASNESESPTPTIKVGNLEVMTEDLGLMDWDAAKSACAALGDRWRLPTRDELRILYENKAKIGSFASNSYWSSTESNNSNAWVQTFFMGFQIPDDKLGDYHVRAVSSF